VSDVLFEDVNGQAVPLLPVAADGSPRVADGARYLNLSQAAKRFAKGEALLRSMWFATWGEYLPPADAPPVLPDGAAAAPSELQSDHPAARAKQAVLRRILFGHLADDEFEYVMEVCRQRRLNPWTRQIAAESRTDPVTRRKTVEIITTIAAFRILAARTGLYGGQTKPMFCGTDERWRDIWPSEDEPPYAAQVGIIHKEYREPIYGTVYWRERVRTVIMPDGTPVRDEFWQRMPLHMLQKCAEADGFRRAFTDDLGGLMTFDETSPKLAAGADGKFFGTASGATPAAAAVSGAASPTAGAQRSPKLVDPDAVIIDDSTPMTDQQFQLELVDLGFNKPDRRSMVIQQFRSKLPKLYELNKIRFFATVLTLIRENPDAYGATAA
jgi:phage recombination protein Bet